MGEVEGECSVIEEKEEIMVPLNSGSSQTFRKAHILKPIFSNNPNFDQSYPKLPSNPPLYPNTIKLFKTRVEFYAKMKPLEHWNSWVNNLKQTHQQLWKKVGIFDAIMSSTYKFNRDKELIMRLAAKWCVETNTFVFPWGECSITMEDVMILGGFSVAGVSDRNQIVVAEDGEIQGKLVQVFEMLKKRSKEHRVSHIEWLNYFRGRGVGDEDELEHVAFLALWLSRYVFTTRGYNFMSLNVFLIAVTLSKGTRIAFAPVILASIYRELRLLKEKIVTFNCECYHHYDGLKLVLLAPFQLVQFWAWERFPTLGPKPNCLAYGEPRVARWHGIKRTESRTLRLEVGSVGDDFLWRPYALHLKNWDLPRFYCDQEMWVRISSEVDEQILSFARCLRACNLEGIDYVEQYLPHRVAMQFALDQDIPFSVPRLCADSEPLDGLEIYIPARLFEGDVTLRYSEWWRTTLFPTFGCERRKRSSRKLKKASKVHDFDHERNCKRIRSCSSYKAVGYNFLGISRVTQNDNPSSLKASELGEDNVINLGPGLEDTDKCRDVVQKSNRSERARYWHKKLYPTSSTPACNEAIDSDFVGSGSDMLIENSSSCKDISSHIYEHVADKIMSFSLIETLTMLEKGTEEIKGSSIEVDRKKEMNNSCYSNLDVSSKSPEGTHSTSVIHVSLAGPPTCNEVMSTDFVQSSCDMLDKNHSSCKGSISPETEGPITNQIVSVSVMKQLIGENEDERQLECNIGEQDKENEVAESYMNVGEGKCTHHDSNGSLSKEEPLMGCEVNTLSCDLVLDEQGEAREDVNCLNDNTVILSEEEEEDNFVCDAFKARCLALDARISRLESIQKTGKLKFKAVY